MNRRQFLTVSAALAGAKLFSSPGALAASAGPRIEQHVGLGSWITFNVGNNKALLDESADVIAQFAAAGGGMIDSSPMYGSAQNTIGYGLRKLGSADGIMSVDKVWTGDVSEGPDQIETSRKAWGVEKFDLLQVHNLVSWEGHLDTLQAMKDAGNLGRIGITTSHGRRHREFERAMMSPAVETVQLTYNAIDREAEDRLLPLAQERGQTVIINRPFQRGALTKRMEGVALPGYAAELGAESWAELLLKFILSHPAKPIPIPATRNVAHLIQNKRAEAGTMPDAKLRERIAADIAAA